MTWRMTWGVTWLAGLLRRRSARMVAQAAAVALAVACLASLGAFFTASKASMTTDAIGAVPVDWQIQLGARTPAEQALATIRATPGITAALPVSYATTPGISSHAGGTTQTTGSGAVLGLPDGYATTFPGEVRPLVGATSGVLLAQQTAANLGAGVGSTVTIERAHQPPIRVRVAGVVDLPAADQLFQRIGAPAGSGPTAPPDNVVLLPVARWNDLYAHAPAHSTSVQVHAALAHDLPPDPGAAFTQVLGRAKNLEAALAGGAVVGNNLAAQLDGARSDAIYSQLLFLFLGLPAVLIAAALAGVVAATGQDRRRDEQALLRIRGASPRAIVRLAVLEALLVGAIGAVVGIAAAAGAGAVLLHTARLGATPGQAVIWTVVSIVFGLGLACAIIAVPAWRDVRRLTVRRSQLGEMRAARRPLWARLFLDVACLAAGALIYQQAVRNGYQVVLAPEGVPTISVNYLTLLAPVLFWIGAALLIARVGAVLLRHGRRWIAASTRPIAHRLSGVVAASMTRRGRPLSRGLVLVALTASFAVSVGLFNTTYAAQARVDAELTNGADVTVSSAATAGLPPSAAAAIARLPGVTAAQPMQHRFAYVGNDLQDLYGIDPATIGHATSMSNAFFAGGDANATLSALATTPNGVLVSEETVHDFQLSLGDTVNLRLLSAQDQRYHVVPFTYVGVAREFPTAPRDSFLVANASYVAQATHSDAAQVLLVRTAGSPPTVATEIRSILSPTSGATVQDIVTQQHATLSSLTAIDLSGLTRLELSFALVLAAASSGLVLALGIAERRRTFAIATALGARRAELGAFVWSEAIFVTAGGVVLGALCGWGLAAVIVKILTGVFDPPPEHLAVPWMYLAAVAAAAVSSVAIAGASMVRHASRSPMTVLRDL
jgi:putative ABC transport system permease protein